MKQNTKFSHLMMYLEDPPQYLSTEWVLLKKEWSIGGETEQENLTLVILNEFDISLLLSPNNDGERSRESR